MNEDKEDKEPTMNQLTNTTNPTITARHLISMYAGVMATLCALSMKRTRAKTEAARIMLSHLITSVEVSQVMPHQTRQIGGGK